MHGAVRGALVPRARGPVITEWSRENPGGCFPSARQGGLQPRGTEFKAPEEEAPTQLAPDDRGSCADCVGVPGHLLRPLPSPPHQALLISKDHGKGSHNLGLDAACLAQQTFNWLTRESSTAIQGWP